MKYCRFGCQNSCDILRTWSSDTPLLFKMPFRSGRKGAADWADLKEVESDKLKVMCIYCTALITKKIERVRAHLRKCNNLTI